MSPRKNIQKKLQETFNNVLAGLVLDTAEKHKIEYDWENFGNFQIAEKCTATLKEKIKSDFSKKYEQVTKNKISNIQLRERFSKEYFGSKSYRCCLCGQLFEQNIIKNKKAHYNCSMVTIEHIFPKDKFPQYALCLENWIPCCYECNSLEKGNRFFVDEPKKEFYDALVQLGINDSFGKEPLQIWKNISFDFSKINGEILVKGKPEGPTNKKAFQLLDFYGLNNRYKAIQRSFYSNLFNLLKCHNISSPEAMESFLEGCQNTNMQEMVSDFSFNNYPELWHEFIDYVLYDYNNLTALWEEIKEYNKLRYFKF